MLLPGGCIVMAPCLSVPGLLTPRPARSATGQAKLATARVQSRQAGQAGALLGNE